MPEYGQEDQKAKKVRNICIAHYVKNGTLYSMIFSPKNDFQAETVVYLHENYEKETLVLHRGYKQNKICQLKIN